MSTLPGHDSLRDAGLEGADPLEPVSIVEEVLVSAEAEPDPEEYRPAAPRPDTAGGADEADVADQTAAVPVVDEDVL